MKRYTEKLAVTESRRILNDDDDLVCITGRISVWWRKVVVLEYDGF